METYFIQKKIKGQYISRHSGAMIYYAQLKF